MQPKEMQLILNEIEKAYQNHDFDIAVELFNKSFCTNISNKEKSKIHFITNLSGLIVDVAGLAIHQYSSLSDSEAIFENIEQCLVKVIDHFEKHLPVIQKIHSGGMASYNFATALSTLFSFKRLREGKYLLPENAELLVKAKKQFWIAIRAAKKNKLEIITNLAHVLSSCGRITEALYLYDIALKENNNFFQANYSRALGLEYMVKLSSSYSINQAYEIYSSYHKASLVENVHISMRDQASKRATSFLEYIKKNGFSEKDISEDSKKNKAEFEKHSSERKYFINNGLALSEHSLYCGCLASSRDNLSILKSSGAIGGHFVPRQEHILNQIKTEFFQARKLYFSSVTSPSNSYVSQDYDLCLSNLGGHEISGLRSEDLRNSFKICFGVLDKIALAVCELFDFTVGKNEKIYFESFWKINGDKFKEAQEARWKEFNSIKENQSLFALYYQSTDLDSENGEWKKFKIWRNALEHGYFVLVHSKNKPKEPFDIYNSKFPVLIEEYNQFEERTAELLRFTRSAIFNFVFSVRREGEKSSNSSSDSSTVVTFNKKN